MFWPRNTSTRCSPQACLIARTVGSESSLVRSTPLICAPQARESGVTVRSMTSCMGDPPRIHVDFLVSRSCRLDVSARPAARSGLNDDIIVFQPDRKGFRDERSLHQLGPRTHRHRILPDA